MKGLTDIPGIKVGHVSDFDGLTGCTAIVCEQGAVAGASLGGFATGTQELDVLSPSHITPAIHAICLAGGSAFGLEAASGVRNHLAKQGVGFYQATAATIANAWIRPRFAGYVAFQTAASALLRKALAGSLPFAATLEAIRAQWRASKFHLSENGPPS